ncbi:MAG: response regulator transcription factor [Campylobacterota bacterium]|nr:response regulator transcription factor [Campylobacterota bacterium]
MTFEKVYNCTKSLNILYVEDNVDFNRDTCEVFEKFFVKVDSVYDGLEALDRYNSYYDKFSKYYDIVITDVVMPNMNGVELVKELYKINNTQSIIVISAHSESDYLMEFVNMGIEQFLLKPFNIKNLLEILYKVSKKLIKEPKIKTDKILTEFPNDYYWDCKNNSLLYKNDNIKLTKKEMMLIKLFVKNGNHITTLSEIYNTLWVDQAQYHYIENISPIISRLRKKVPGLTVQSSYGVGYKLIF